mmetsp:Transcript_17390/g.20188  ORF Transcript_17390/g.20188 Transcript_17390/m.20188 type:complete len:233 (+) Transcript_17390:13-711(+)
MENESDEKSSTESFDPNDENVLFETTVRKEFLIFFKKSYDLKVTDFRVVILYKDGDLNKESDVKRSISYSRLKGITKSTAEVPKAFVLHVKSMEDEYVFCEDIEEPISMIKKVYASLLKKNLPIFGVESNYLSEYATSDKDALLGISRMPLKRFRMKEERILTDESSSDDDEEDKELFSDFLVINRDEVKEIDRFLKKFNKQENLDKEQEEMKNGESILLFSKKVRSSVASE